MRAFCVHFGVALKEKAPDLCNVHKAVKRSARLHANLVGAGCSSPPAISRKPYKNTTAPCIKQRTEVFVMVVGVGMFIGAMCAARI